MLIRRAPSRADFASLGLKHAPRRRQMRYWGILAAALLLAFLLMSWLYLR